MLSASRNFYSELPDRAIAKDFLAMIFDELPAELGDEPYYFNIEYRKCEMDKKSFDRFTGSWLNDRGVMAVLAFFIANANPDPVDTAFSQATRGLKPNVIDSLYWSNNARRREPIAIAGDRLTILLYNPDNHWIPLVIDPPGQKLYIFDALSNAPGNKSLQNPHETTAKSMIPLLEVSGEKSDLQNQYTLVQ